MVVSTIRNALIFSVATLDEKQAVGVYVITKFNERLRVKVLSNALTWINEYLEGHEELVLARNFKKLRGHHCQEFAVHWLPSVSK